MRLQSMKLHGGRQQHQTRCHRHQLVRAQAGGPNNTNNGLGVLTWTGNLVPQGAKTSWNLVWEAFMRELAPQTKDGSFARPAYTFTGQIGDAQHPSAAGRYVLYVGNACPWCHRVMLALHLRGLSQAIQVVQLTDDPTRASRGGWVLDVQEPVFQAKDLREVYDAASPGYRGRCTAPLLVDAINGSIVCNESSIMVHNLNRVQLPGASDVDLAPAELQGQIRALNQDIYDNVNNAVYRCGFATTQFGYDAAVRDLFDTLDRLEERVTNATFLHGDRVTESDVWLYPTLVRFDAIYATLFKAGKRRIADYPGLHLWLRRMHHLPLPGGGQVADIFSLKDAHQSYYTSLFPLNPGGIVPACPEAALQPIALPVEEMFHKRQAQPVASA